MITTYELSPDGRTITCKRCGKTSYNPEDVRLRFCGWCRVFHDDIYPPARQHWLDQGPPPKR